MTPELAEAVAIFRELGWEGEPYERAPDLPVGTPAQQRAARKGLQRGDWGHFGAVGPNTARWINEVEVDPHALGLFAIRVGVDARRALELAPNARAIDDDVLLACLAPRGPEFAASFVRRACLREWRQSDRSSSPYGPVAFRLAALHDLPVPDAVGYLLDWTVVAAWALGEDAEIVPPRPAPPGEDQVERRFEEHVRAAVAAGVSGTSPLPAVLAAGVRRGRLGRVDALSLAFQALDTAVRPSDRKAWAAAIAHGLDATDTELAARTPLLVAVLSTGETPVVETFAPRLLGVVPDDLLPDVLSSSLTARTKKALLVVLRAAALRRPAAPVVGELAELVEPFAGDKDRAVAAAAAGVLDAWGTPHEVPEPEPTVARGWWQPTPALWEVPRFDVGAATPEELTDLAALLLGRPENARDVENERLLVLANELACRDDAAVRRALQGVPVNHHCTLFHVPAWLDGSLSGGGRSQGATVRDEAVWLRLGELPSVLSTPTWVDLRIDPRELLDRLEAYAAAEVDVAEPDLLLALDRVDRTLVTPELLRDLGGVAVRARQPDGALVPPTAGVIARDILGGPGPEPDPLAPPGADRGFGRYLPKSCDGVTWRQLVRRSGPLSGAEAIHLIGVQRTAHPRAAADLARAATEAWQRGLLRPGVADVTHLRDRKGIAQLAALAAVLLDLARDGMASVAWPVLDDLLVASLHDVRLPAGTAEVAEAMRDLVPEALAAVASGVAPGSAVDVPGLRALASRSGSSRAVVAAREAVGLLPPATRPAARAEAVAVEPVEVDLDAVWPPATAGAPAREDDAEVRLRWRGSRLDIGLLLPDGRVMEMRSHHRSGSRFDLDGLAYAWDGRLPVYVHEHGGRLVATPHDQRPALPDGRASMTVSLIVVALAAALEEGVDGRASAGGVAGLARAGAIGSAGVRKAMHVLLGRPEVSPTRLLRMFEWDPDQLPALWPLLTEPIRFAGESAGSPPRWTHQVLAVAIQHAPTLRAAAAAGRLPADAAGWPGLAELAARPGKSATLERARSLQTLLS
ncbi:MAG TPA: hypothetical protein VNS46_01510 [Nocardioides sp.]|nr:hypothetical protein [Nocardioides sp.]